MTVKLLTEHHLKFLSLKGGCTGSSESTLVKMTQCWKSHDVAHFTPQSSSTSGLNMRCTMSKQHTCHDGVTHRLPDLMCIELYLNLRV